MAKPQSGKDIRSRLKEAQEHQTLVRVSRSIRGSDKLDGFVVGISRKWALLAVLDDLIILNGYVAVRISDMAKLLQARGSKDTFIRRALVLRGEWPPAPAGTTLDTTAGLVQSAADRWPLVTLHLERENPDVCYVGRPLGFTSRSVKWRDISTTAEWQPDVSRFPLADLTRVEFGGRYEDALAAVAGSPTP